MQLILVRHGEPNPAEAVPGVAVDRTVVTPAPPAGPSCTNDTGGRSPGYGSAGNRASGHGGGVSGVMCDDGRSRAGRGPADAGSHPCEQRPVGYPEAEVSSGVAIP